MTNSTNSAQSAPTFAAMNTGAQTILIAEDDPDDLRLLMRVFGIANIRNPMQVVTNGEDVVAYLAGAGAYGDRNRYPYPSLLLLDLKMPRLSGFDVLAWIRNRPEHDSLCVVVLTGGGSMRDIRQAYRLGADSFLTKPLSMEEFQNLVDGMSGFRMESGPEGKVITLTRYPPPAMLIGARRSISVHLDRATSCFLQESDASESAPHSQETAGQATLPGLARQLKLASFGDYYYPVY